MNSPGTHFDMSKKKTIIFDFDGTLADIQPMFIKLFNTLASEFGYAPIRPEEIPELKKLHLKSLVWKRLRFRIFFFFRILRRGREEYHKHISEVNLFPGMRETLDALRAHGYHLGIVSSSQKETISALLEKFGIPMDFIYQSSLFNKAKTLREAMTLQGLSLSETLYVGDEVRDVEACQRIGLDIISVSWGLNSKEALQNSGHQIIVDQPSGLLEILLHA